MCGNMPTISSTRMPERIMSQPFTRWPTGLMLLPDLKLLWSKETLMGTQTLNKFRKVVPSATPYLYLKTMSVVNILWKYKGETLIVNLLILIIKKFFIQTLLSFFNHINDPYSKTQTLDDMLYFCHLIVRSIFSISLVGCTFNRRLRLWEHFVWKWHINVYTD